jgi:hypothetical protein
MIIIITHNNNIDFIIKMSRMEEQEQINPINSNTCFCFKYCINLGDGKFGTMKINEKTNLYE